MIAPPRILGANHRLQFGVIGVGKRTRLAGPTFRRGIR
jgi:hypothetical protein